MRTTTRFVLIGTAGLIAAACSGKDNAMSADLKKDLDMASTSDGLALATPAAKGSQVVSAIERTTPPAPRQIAQSQRITRHKPAPKAPPAPVEAQQADVSPQVAVQPVVNEPAPTEQVPAETPRPHPVEMPNGSGMPRGNGGGVSAGTILGGIISVVLRGGGVDGDNCDPRPGSGGRYPGSINNRFPTGVGTFPSGGGRYPSGGGRYGGRGR